MHDDFHVLEPQRFPFSYKVGPTHAENDFREARLWCIAQFGGVRRMRDGRDMMISTDSQWHHAGDGVFWFRTQPQAFDFMLRWG